MTFVGIRRKVQQQNTSCRITVGVNELHNQFTNGQTTTFGDSITKVKVRTLSRKDLSVISLEIIKKSVDTQLGNTRGENTFSRKHFNDEIEQILSGLHFPRLRVSDEDDECVLKKSEPIGTHYLNSGKYSSKMFDAVTIPGCSPMIVNLTP